MKKKINIEIGDLVMAGGIWRGRVGLVMGNDKN